MAWLRIIRVGAVAIPVGMCPGLSGWAAGEPGDAPAVTTETTAGEAHARDVISQLRQSLYQAVKDAREAGQQRDEAHARVTRLDAERGPLLVELESLKGALEDQEDRFTAEIEALRKALLEAETQNKAAAAETGELADERVRLQARVSGLEAEVARLAQLTNAPADRVSTPVEQTADIPPPPPRPSDEIIAEANRMLRAGDLLGAERLLDEALAQAPDDVRLLNGRGVVAFRQDRHRDARSDLERAVELDERDPEGHFNLAVLLTLQPEPDLENARRHYDAALTHGGRRDEKLEQALGL